MYNETNLAKKETIFTLADDFVELLELSEDGDISEEDFERELEMLKTKLDGKTESWLKVAMELKTRGDAKVAYAKSAAENIKKVKTDGERSIAHAKRMYDVVKDILILQGNKKFEGELLTATVRKNAPSLVIDNYEDIPDEYLIPQDPTINVKAIKEALINAEKEGRESPCSDFAHLERSKTLIVK